MFVLCSAVSDESCKCDVQRSLQDVEARKCCARLCGQREWYSLLGYGCGGNVRRSVCKVFCSSGKMGGC
jgi:hypothetical protein